MCTFPVVSRKHYNTEIIHLCLLQHPGQTAAGQCVTMEILAAAWIA